MDPACIIIQQRIMHLRRACERKAPNKEKARTKLKKYENNAEPATVAGNLGLYGEPCIHPNIASRVQFKAESNPRGPIGLILQS